mgnify:CR=1 FL=1
MGFQDGDIRRVSACIDAQFGLIGCTKSHIKAMTEFFITENAEYCLVLEDDFDFLNSARKLEIYREHTAARGAFTYWYGLDMMWKHLQREDKWYIFNPVLGVQRPSFSDIEGKHTDYSNAFRHPSTQG